MFRCFNVLFSPALFLYVIWLIRKQLVLRPLDTVKSQEFDETYADKKITLVPSQSYYNSGMGEKYMNSIC